MYCEAEFKRIAEEYRRGEPSSEHRLTRFSKRALITEIYPAIITHRAEGYTYKGICEYLARIGAKLSESTLKNYLREARREREGTSGTAGAANSRERRKPGSKNPPQRSRARAAEDPRPPAPPDGSAGDDGAGIAADARGRHDDASRGAAGATAVATSVDTQAQATTSTAQTEPASSANDRGASNDEVVEVAGGGAGTPDATSVSTSRSPDALLEQSNDDGSSKSNGLGKTAVGDAAPEDAPPAAATRSAQASAETTPRTTTSDETSPTGQKAATPEATIARATVAVRRPNLPALAPNLSTTDLQRFGNIGFVPRR